MTQMGRMNFNKSEKGRMHDLSKNDIKRNNAGKKGIPITKTAEITDLRISICRYLSPVTIYQVGSEGRKIFLLVLPP